MGDRKLVQAPSTRSGVIHSRPPTWKRTICGVKSFKESDEPWRPDIAWACITCVRSWRAYEAWQAQRSAPNPTTPTR